MDLVTFPLQLNRDFHKTIKTAAFNEEKTIKDFIIEAVIEKMQKDKK